MTTLTKSQKKVFGPVTYTEDGRKFSIKAFVRHDDNCGNGHNTFSVTADIRQIDEFGVQREWMGGCCHNEVAKHFPNLAPMIKYHLCSTDGPMHYIANTVYHASDKDYNGLRKGEKKQLRNGRTKQFVWQRVVRNEKGEEIKGNDWVDSDEKPTEKFSVDWEPVWVHGEGKKRELDHARSCAIWPEATDEELTQNPEQLKAALSARLPKLMEEFRKAVESLGFVY